MLEGGRRDSESAWVAARAVLFEVAILVATQPIQLYAGVPSVSTV